MKHWWRYKVRFQAVKFFRTLGICARIIMARTFGQYVHSGWNGQCAYARYCWRGHDYYIQTNPAKPTEPEPLARPAPDHGFEGGATDAYCAKCGRAYFSHVR